VASSSIAENQAHSNAARMAEAFCTEYLALALIADLRCCNDSLLVLLLLLLLALLTRAAGYIDGSPNSSWVDPLMAWFRVSKQSSVHSYLHDVVLRTEVISALTAVSSHAPSMRCSMCTSIEVALTCHAGDLKNCSIAVNSTTPVTIQAAALSCTV
jgi:hypothetical protein